MSEHPFAPFLQSQGFVLLDGGLATALETAGYTLDESLWSASCVIDAPGAVRSVHTSYLEAGADCITTAGYQASVEGFLAAGLDREGAEEALRRGVELAVEARDAFWSNPAHGSGRLEPIVAASAGPYGAFLADGSEYDGRYGVERAVLERFHRARLDVLRDTAADVVAFETIPSALESEVLAELLADRDDTRAWISYSCRDSETLWDGTPIAEAVRSLGSVRGLVGVGINCTAPRHVGALVDKIAAVTDLPIIVYPNSGEGYDVLKRSWLGPPAEWLDSVGEWVESGAVVLGGCCRVGPDQIRRLRTRLEDMHAL
jgi:homocysteine S-methyltransferase